MDKTPTAAAEQRSSQAPHILSQHSIRIPLLANRSVMLMANEQQRSAVVMYKTAQHPKASALN